MKITEPICDLKHEPTPRKSLFFTALSTITFIPLFFCKFFVLCILYPQNFTCTATNSSLPEESFRRYSPSDCLRWERTAFHFQPAKNFLYDPNGPLFHMGWYHLFYQHNPYAPVWGLRCDYGRFFASKSIYDPLKKRRVTWGYVGESDNPDEDISRGWATLYNVGTTVVLDRKTGTHLLHWPVEEIESLRHNGRQFEEIKHEPGSIIPLDLGITTQLDIVATFEVDQRTLNVTHESNNIYGCTTSTGATQRGRLGPFGVAVLADGTLSELTPVYFYIAKNANGGVSTHFCTDKLRSSLTYDGERVVYGSTVPVIGDEKLTMRLLVDHSIVEGFAQGGRTVITSRVYPTKAIYEEAKVFLFNNVADTSVKASIKIWQMAPAHIRPYPF